MLDDVVAAGVSFPRGVVINLRVIRAEFARDGRAEVVVDCGRIRLAAAVAELDAEIAEVAERATGESVARAAFDIDAAAARVLEDEVAHVAIARVFERDERLFENRDDDTRGREFGEGPHVELAGGGIDIPFARRIEFLEKIQRDVGVVVLAAADRVEVRCAERDLFRGGIDFRDADFVVGVAVVEVALKPNVGHADPALMTQVGVFETARAIRVIAGARH